MKTYEFLTGDMAPLFWPAVVAGVAIALIGALLSVPVVLKRLAFIGQGVSHAAFGGAGVALVLGLTGTTAAMSLAYLGVVGMFCVLTALGVAWAASRPANGAGGEGARGPGEQATGEDTLIGVFLVASMALGSLLTHWHTQRLKHGNAAGNSGPVRSAEQILFGSIFDVSWTDAVLAWGVLLVTLVTLIHTRRAMAFWLFDEPAASAFGVPVLRLRYLLLALLGIATVTAMKLAGAVLATALLVIPGAVALRLTQRLNAALLLACISGLVGMLGGLVLSFEFDWPPGASVVMVLAGQFVLASVWGGVWRGIDRAFGGRAKAPS
ncbi:MAG: metal ABC transporter permease [Phycisphaerales bacterium]